MSIWKTPVFGNHWFWGLFSMVLSALRLTRNCPNIKWSKAIDVWNRDPTWNYEIGSRDRGWQK